MHICLDYTYGVDACSGIGRYANQLARSFAQTQGEDLSFSLFFIDFLRHFSSDTSCPECAADPRFSFAPAHLLPARVYERAWNLPGIRRFFGPRGVPADLYHITSHAAIPCPRSKKLVCTIHDMAAWNYPDHSVMAKDRRAIRTNALLANAIIADSQFAADDIVRYLPETLGKIHVVHLGIDHAIYTPSSADEVAEMRQVLKLERPYILSVGLVHPTKNHLFLGKVLEALGRDDIDLVISGAPSYSSDQILSSFSALRCSKNIHVLGRVDDRWLPALYSGAEIYATASLSEGFGFTPLEAMACGTPVVASSAGSLPEVLGNAAAVLPDYDLDRWTETIRGLLDHPSQRAEQSCTGKEWAARYTWKRTAAKTLDVYRSV